MSTDIKQALETLQLPAKVKRWRIEEGEDSVGEDAVWVWITLDDKDLVEKKREAIRQAVRSAVFERMRPRPSGCTSTSEAPVRMLLDPARRPAVAGTRAGSARASQAQTGKPSTSDRDSGARSRLRAS